MDSSWIIGLFVAEIGLAIFAAELRNLRWATITVALQSLVLVAIISSLGYLSGNSSLYWWGTTAFIIKVLFIPWLLWMYTYRVPVSEVKPVIGLIPSIILMAVILPITYQYMHIYLCPYFMESLPPVYSTIAETAGMNLALGFTMLVLGIYVLLVRRDMIKAVIGLVILENGVHLVLVSMAPTLNEAAEIGIACNLVIASWLLLYLSRKIYEIWGTKDSTSLSELKW